MKTARGRNLVTAAAVAILLLVAGLASAQVADATLEVVVSDETGAPLPGVSVRVTRADTGLARQAVSDGVGVARIPSLPTGSYQVVVELPGIPPVTQEDVVLRVGQTARARTGDLAVPRTSLGSSDSQEEA